MRLPGLFPWSIQGFVTDSAEASVAGAAVSLTKKEINQAWQTTTSKSGFYRFKGLTPGPYTVTVEKSGFRKQVIDDIKMEGQAECVDVKLEAGSISETVSVTAENPPIETEDANV
jgi:hypothetical protein